MLGSGSGGGRTDYLSDALGSVTATVSQSPAVVNTYRYKPYGAQLSKTGAGADPKFTWVGTRGYRDTGRPSSDKYVRARHCGTAQAAWTTCDRTWPIERAYEYSRGRATSSADFTGLALGDGIPMTGPYLTYELPLAEGCGHQARTWFLRFMRNLVPADFHDGYVIGHVLAKDMSKVSDRCDNRDPYRPLPILKREWWEAWCVKDGKVHKGDDPKCQRDPVPANFDDGWFVPPEDLMGVGGTGMDCRRGCWSITHFISFFNVKHQELIDLGFISTGIFGGTFGKGQLKLEGPKAPQGWKDDARARINLCISFNCCSDGGCSPPATPLAEPSEAGPVKCKPVPSHGG
jgi:hypothetical protein